MKKQYLIIIALILINILSYKLFFRIDFTSDKKYTLTKETKEIIKNIQQEINIKVYISENLPPDLARIKTEINDILTEYAIGANNKIKYSIINPIESEKLEQQAVKDGITPLLIDVREKNQLKQQKAYMGISISNEKNEKEIIPIIQPDVSYEYPITLAIKKLTIQEKQVVALTQGKGEPDIDAIEEFYKKISSLYDIDLIDFDVFNEIPNHIKTLIIIAPKDSFYEKDFQILDKFLEKGGNLFVAYNAVDANPETQYAVPINTNLENWIKKKGISIESSFIADKQCMPIVFTQNKDGYPVKSTINFPLIPRFTNFSKHPINTGLQSVVLEFASECKEDATKDNVQFIPLIKTSDKTAIIKPPFFFDLYKDWTDKDFPLSNIVVAAMLQGQIVGNKTSRIVLISDGDFIINGIGQSKVKLNEDNLILAENIVDLLSGNSQFFEMRTKETKYRPIIDLSERGKNIIRYFNFLFPIILIIIYGIFRTQHNRILKNSKMY